MNQLYEDHQEALSLMRTFGFDDRVDNLVSKCIHHLFVENIQLRRQVQNQRNNSY